MCLIDGLLFGANVSKMVFRETPRYLKLRVPASRQDRRPCRNASTFSTLLLLDARIVSNVADFP
jgi:hypothetical protein